MGQGLGIGRSFWANSQQSHHNNLCNLWRKIIIRGIRGEKIVLRVLRGSKSNLRGSLFPHPQVQ